MRVALFVLVVSSVCYLGLASTAVSTTTVQYDEFTDLVISASLADNPFRGHGWDPSQARLPMYATALAYWIVRQFDPELGLLDILPVSRWISIAVCVLAIWGTALLGYRLFDQATGLMAAMLFAFSPFVLDFGSDALTQGDAFTPALVVLAVLAFDQFLRRSTILWLVCLSCSLGLAIAAKFTMVFLIAALMTCHLLRELGWSSPDSNTASDEPTRDDARIARAFPWVAASTGLFTAAAVVFSSGGVMFYASVLAWILASLGLMGCLGLAVISPWPMLPQRVPSTKKWTFVGSWIAIVPLALTTALTIFPEHIFNPEILRALFERLMTRDGGGHDLFATAIASGKLYLGILLFKLGLPFGIATTVALGWAARNAIRHREQSCLLITVPVVYFALVLAILPLQQPFWLMSVYPLILLALSGMIVRALRHGNLIVRWSMTAWLVLAVSWLAIGLVRVYPTFGYYGYETTGDRWLGTGSRGYRRLVVVTNDGSTEALDWLQQNAPAGSRVVSFLNDVHLIQYLLDTRSYAFEVMQAQREPDPDRRARAVAAADFAVVRAIDDDDRWQPELDSEFNQRFGKEPVHVISRGRGIYHMPVIRIYRSSVLRAAGTARFFLAPPGWELYGGRPTARPCGTGCNVGLSHPRSKRRESLARVVRRAFDAPVSSLTLIASTAGGQIAVDNIAIRSTTVAEPPTLLLFGSGIALVQVRRWRQRATSR